MTAEWKKFKCTREQCEEMRYAKHGYIYRDLDGVESSIRYGKCYPAVIKEYLICNPLPDAETRIKHILTGQPIDVEFYNRNK